MKPTEYPEHRPGNFGPDTARIIADEKAATARAAADPDAGLSPKHWNAYQELCADVERERQQFS